MHANVLFSPFRHVDSVARKGRPIHLTYFVTRKCNARCPYCFYLASTRAEPQAAVELSLEEIAQVSQSLGSLLWLAFSGGEIFLRKDLAAISRHFYRNNRPAIMLFPSNGTLPDTIFATLEEVLIDCPRSLIVVKLSLDALGEKHDTLRCTPGNFDRLLRTIDALAPLAARHANLEIGVNTVFCSENQDDMTEIFDFVAGLAPVTTHTLSLVRGDLAQPEYLHVDPDKYRRAAEDLARRIHERKTPIGTYRGAKLKAAQDVLQRRAIYRALTTGARAHPCYAGSLSLVLNETGEVFPCETLDASIGNVRDHDYDLSRMLRSDHAKDVLRPIQEKACCCTHECNMLMNVLFDVRRYPALLAQYARMLAT